MDECESLSHSKWECKYHVVFIPKCRRKTLYGELRRHLGAVFRKLGQQKESQIEEGHLMPDHVHMMISIPPKYASTEIRGLAGGRIYQGQECDPFGPCIWGEETQFRGT
jgi:putative transposase